MAKLRLAYCSPYRLYWAWFYRDGSTASFLHRAYGRFVFRQRRVRPYLRIAACTVLWPLIFVIMQFVRTRRLGLEVRARTGKRLLRQTVEQLHLAVFHSLGPSHYYILELFRDERRRRAHEYLPRYELKGGLYDLLESRNRVSTRNLINNKLLFGAYCARHGIVTVRPLLTIDKERRIAPGTQCDSALPQCDLFVKPVKGKGGRGCERWDRQPDGRYAGPSGTVLDWAGLLARLQDRSQMPKYEGIIVQPCIGNHPELADLSERALNTVRILSCKNEVGGFEVTHAVFKMSIKAGAVVDNSHAGGLASSVDVATGELGPATDLGITSACLWLDRHPLTGGCISGRRLPLWRESVALVERAHAVFADRTLIGWDVAITPDGPCLIEANVQAGVDMIQRTNEPLGNTRLGQMFAFHVRRALASPAVDKEPVTITPEST